MLVFLGIIINFLAMAEIATSRPISTGLSTVEKLPESYPRDDVDREQQQLSRASEEVGSRHRITGLRWFLVCLAIFSANILYGLDTTIAADIQASISESFDNVTELSWLGVGFTLGSAVAILPLGKAYAIFDREWIFVGCLSTFAAASALCGGPPSMNAIIVGWVWAGAGGAGMYLG